MMITEKLKVAINRYKSNRNVKDGFLYAIFSFVNNGISFLLLLLIAKFLNPFGYGLINIFTITVTIISLIITFCTNSYVSIAFFKEDTECFKKTISIVFFTGSIISVLLSLITYLSKDFLIPIIKMPFVYILYAILISYFQIFNNLILDIWRLKQQPQKYGLFGISFALVNFATTLLLILCFKLGWSGRVYAWFASSGLYAVLSIILFFKMGIFTKEMPTYSQIKKVFLYVIPLIPHSISFWLKSGLDRYIINYYYDSSVVGYFSFATNIAAIITMLGNAFNSTNSVNIYKKLSAPTESTIYQLNKLNKSMSFFFCAITFFSIIGSFIMMKYIIPSYELSIPFIVPMCISGLFQCIYLLWVNYMFYFGKTIRLMMTTLSTAILQVVLSIWLTKYSPLYTAWISASIMIGTAWMIYFQSKSLISKQLKFS